MKLKQLAIAAALLLVAAGFFRQFPLLRVVSLDERREQQAAEAFDPAAFADFFWAEELVLAFARATPLELLMEELASDPDAAKAAYARQLGLSSTHYYFIQAKARVEALSESQIRFSSLSDPSFSLLVDAPPVFGNSARDATGLLDVNDFPNSQEFNLVSAALNAKVEAMLLEQWPKMKVGDDFRLIACLKVVDRDRDFHPMKLVPLSIQEQ